MENHISYLIHLIDATILLTHNGFFSLSHSLTLLLKLLHIILAIEIINIIRFKWISLEIPTLFEHFSSGNKEFFLWSKRNKVH